MPALPPARIRNKKCSGYMEAAGLVSPMLDWAFGYATWFSNYSGDAGQAR